MVCVNVFWVQERREKMMKSRKISTTTLRGSSRDEKDAEKVLKVRAPTVHEQDMVDATVHEQDMVDATVHEQDMVDATVHEQLQMLM